MPSEDEALVSHSEADVQDDEKMWPVVEILAEKSNLYRVKWEGINPNTGKPWPSSWIPKKDASTALVDDWKQNKMRKAQRRRQSKSTVSKAKSRSHASKSSKPTGTTSGTPSTSISAHIAPPAGSVLSISSNSSVQEVKNLPKRKRHTTPESSVTSSLSLKLSSPMPRKKRKIEDKQQSAIGAYQEKALPVNALLVLSKEGTDRDKVCQVQENYQLNGKRISTDKKGSKTTLPPEPGPSIMIPESTSVMPQPPKTTEKVVNTRNSDNRDMIQVSRSLLRQEDEESSQQSTRVAPKPQQTAKPPQSTSNGVPYVDLLRIRKSSKTKLRRSADEGVDIQASIEDISIPQSGHEDIVGVHFALQEEYDADGGSVGGSLTGTQRSLPPQSVSYNPQLNHPTTSNRGAVPNNNQGSKIISRMKSNRSISGQNSSPIRANNGEGKFKQLHTNGRQGSTTDKVSRLLPQIAPSNFAPYLPSPEDPISSIEDFTPDRSRSTQRKTVITEMDDILDLEDSFVHKTSRKRGLELTNKLPELRNQEQAISIPLRKPLDIHVSFAATDDMPPVPQSTIFDEVFQGDEHDLLQEMVDSYVDLSGGFPEEDNTQPDGTVPFVNENKLGQSDSAQPVILSQKSHEELPPTESVHHNTDSQGKSLELDINKSQQLDNAVKLLHDKSEEIDSLQTQLSEHIAKYAALRANFETLQTRLDELFAENSVKTGALTEAKKYSKQLEAHLNSFEHKQSILEEEKRQLVVEMEERRKKRNMEEEVERSESASRKDELEKAVSGHIQRLTDLESSWLQRQAVWETEQKAWSAEKRAWMEKENSWKADEEEMKKKNEGWEKEKETLVEKIKSAEKDSEFFRNQYSTASSFADSVRVENAELKKQIEEFKIEATVARGQAMDGVKLVKETFLLKIEKLQEEIDKTRSICDLLKTKEKRTDDEIRRRAALYPELQDENAKLRAQLNQVFPVDSTSRLEDDGDDDNVDDVSDSNSSLDYEDEPAIVDTDHSDGEYWCKWNDSAYCHASFSDLQELADHIQSKHILI